MKFSDDEKKHIILLFGKFELPAKVRRQFLTEIEYLIVKQNNSNAF